MARFDMALADVALARQLALTLAGLPGPCGALRSQLVVAADGPPWVKYVLFDAERGIALIDFAPARPSRGMAPLKAFLAEAGFANRYPGELPVVAVELALDEISMTGERIAAAFAAAPPCAIKDVRWCDAINRLLMTAEGLTMARVVPAPGAAASGPVRLAAARQNAVVASAAPAPLLRKPILERPFLQQPLPERPVPKRAPLQKLFLRKPNRKRPFLQKPILERPVLERPILEKPVPGKPESRSGFPADPVMRLRVWPGGDYPRAALAIAALSVAALAIGAAPYQLDASSPAVQAPAAISFPIEVAAPSFPIEAAAPRIPIPAVESAAATEGSAVPPSPVVEAVEPPSANAPSVAVDDAAPPPSTIAEAPPAPVSAPSAAVAVEADPVRAEATAPVETKPPTPIEATQPGFSAPKQAQDTDAFRERGEALLASGDIVSARHFFEYAANRGDTAAATQAGKTYDPNFLRRAGARGIPGDSDRATYWYRQAAGNGHPEAAANLKRLLGQ